MVFFNVEYAFSQGRVPQRGKREIERDKKSRRATVTIMTTSVAWTVPLIRIMMVHNRVHNHISSMGETLACHASLSAYLLPDRGEGSLISNYVS